MTRIVGQWYVAATLFLVWLLLSSTSRAETVMAAPSSQAECSTSAGIEVLKDGYGGVSVKTSGGASKAAGLSFSWSSVAQGRLEVSINPVLLKRLADPNCENVVSAQGIETL